MSELEFPMYQADIDAWLRENPHNANCLLMQADPKFEKRFKKIDKELIALLKDVQKYFPNAVYFTENSSEFYLMLGSTHTEGTKMLENKKFIALAGDAIIDGGAW